MFDSPKTKKARRPTLTLPHSTQKKLYEWMNIEQILINFQPKMKPPPQKNLRKQSKTNTTQTKQN